MMEEAQPKEGVAPGEAPARTPQAAVSLPNPYSARREETLAYLAYIAQAQEGSVLVSRYELNKPQESSEYRRRYATLVENRYLVDEPAKGRYLALLPTFQMPAYSLPESAYETLLFRLIRGEMEAGEFCQELDHIQRAWLMENQISFGE